MAVGLAATTLANKWLDLLRGTAFTAPSNLYVKLHKNTGDPGSAGTANSSAVSTRVLTTFSAASGGAIALGGANSAPTWTMSTTENIQFISVWDTVGPTGGNFLWSAELSASKNVQAGDTLTLTTCGLTLTPVAS